MLRLLPWSPEYGSAMQADPDSFDAADDSAAVDTSIEGEWRARPPLGEPPAAVQIVDGVRRVEAHAIDDLADGETAFGLFGSYAVGAVRCEGDRSWVLDGDAAEGERLRVFRVYLQGGGEPRDQEVAAGALRLHFRARIEGSARTSNQLADVLQRSMLDAEAQLAEALAEDESALTIVDGPLRLRSVGQRVAGYIKRIQSWYIAAHEFALLGQLAVGERTPLFRIAGGGEAGSRGRPDRYAWYLRIADMGAHYHQLSGIVRLEAPGALPLGEAARLADECGLALPRLASSPVRDPRAPQNLTPVGALESLLTRRLGEREWVRRLIASALRAAPQPLEPAAPREGLRSSNGAGGARW
ncbi:MAG: hypothetical protein F4X76_07450 [Chloroflexi bacterium]|nr:hypothetical protein [Chloroflexota bacterium]